jgi:hypothetical protein
MTDLSVGYTAGLIALGIVIGEIFLLAPDLAGHKPLMPSLVC